VKELLRKMLEGWAIAYNENIKASEAFDRICDDPREAQLLDLFGHWSNDVTSMANHYGLDCIKIAEDGEKIWNDNKIDTLLRKGVLTVVEIPEAPSIQHWWSEGKWKAPECD